MADMFTMAVVPAGTTMPLLSCTSLVDSLAHESRGPGGCTLRVSFTTACRYDNLATMDSPVDPGMETAPRELRPFFHAVPPEVSHQEMARVAKRACDLQEMIFRRTDTTALLTEWVMADLVFNPRIQEKLQRELDEVVGKKRSVEDADVAKLSYLQAVVKETRRVHPPGPLLSWARLSTSDVHLSNGMVVPAGTTAMVNMSAITHDDNVWEDAGMFRPERFVEKERGGCVDVRGNDLRFAPFGAGRRVCPGKDQGLVTVSLAKLVHHFIWEKAPGKGVDLREVLKLSLEMKNPLCAVAIPRASSAL